MGNIFLDNLLLFFYALTYIKKSVNALILKDMIDKTDSLHTPKYIKIAESIRQEIDLNMNVGERIYSEKEIMDKYEVSSTTARKALEVLRNEKIIERIQGKGTFIIQKKVLRSLRKIVSFTENMKKQDIIPSTKMLEKEILSDYTEYHKKLQLLPGDKILKLKRIKFGNNIPLAIDYRYINLRYCPDIYDKDLNSSLYQLYDQYNIKIAHSRQYLELAFIDDKNAKLLNCNPGDPVIYIEGLLSLENYEPIEYEENLWNGRIFRFQFEASL